VSDIPANDREILRALGRDLAAAAADPVNVERRRVCHLVDTKQKSRPSISIFQEPWNELNVNGDLDLRCTDGFCRGIEQGLRQTLYKWRHYPGDMTVSAVSVQPYCVHSTGFGINEDVDVERTDPTSGVVSRHFHIQIKDEHDIDKMKAPVITHDTAATEEGYQKRGEIFDGILDVCKRGTDGFWFAPWDHLVRLTGVQEVLMDLVMRPEYVHKCVGHLVDCWLDMLRQYEEQNLLTAPAKKLTVSGASPPAVRSTAATITPRRYRPSRRGCATWGCPSTASARPTTRSVARGPSTRPSAPWRSWPSEASGSTSCSRPTA